MNRQFPNAQSVALIANGTITDTPLISQLISQYERVVAVDGGINHCHQMNLQPDLIVGDCDSTTTELLHHYAHIPIRKFPCEKNETDLELALQIANTPSIEKIGIFAAAGDRIDHSLNNLNLLFHYPNKVVIETESQSVFAISGSKTIHCSPGQTLSLLPLNSSATGVSTRGLQWEIQQAAIDSYFRSLSNRCLGSSVTITIERGQLICCLQRML